MSITSLSEKTILGKTGLKVGKLGIAASYGVPTNAIEEAFEAGCNYFYWASLRTKKMRDAINNIVSRGKRDDLVIAVQSYIRFPSMIESSLTKALKKLKLEYVELLILGAYKKEPNQKIIETILKLKEKGYCKYLGISGHNRKLFPELIKLNVFDVFQIRYNAGHRGIETEVFPNLPEENRPGIVTYTATKWGKLLDKKNFTSSEKTPTASDCYRFVLSNPNVDVVLTGPKTYDQMKENLKILSMNTMSEDELNWMRRIGDSLKK